MTDIAPIIKEFNEFWTSLNVDEVAFPNRKAATMRQWLARSSAARKAMKDQVDKTGPPPKKKNPFFWVQDFPEPRPTNYNGMKLKAGVRYVIAKYHGSYGTYSLDEAILFDMYIKTYL